MYPPTQNGKVEISGQSDIWILANVPPPQNEKVGFQVKVTFCFWPMYPPPPRNCNWTKHECYRNNNHLKRGHQVHFINLPPPPFQYHYLTICLIRKLVNFNFKWIFGLEPHPPPFSSQKNKMLVFVLCSTSGDWLDWSMDLDPICHPTPAKKMKCSFLDYVQLLMISQAGQWTQTPSTTPLHPKKIKCLFLDYVQLLRIG